MWVGGCVRACLLASPRALLMFLFLNVSAAKHQWFKRSRTLILPAGHVTNQLCSTFMDEERNNTNEF